MENKEVKPLHDWKSVGEASSPNEQAEQEAYQRAQRAHARVRAAMQAAEGSDDAGQQARWKIDAAYEAARDQINRIGKTGLVLSASSAALAAVLAIIESTYQTPDDGSFASPPGEGYPELFALGAGGGGILTSAVWLTLHSFSLLKHFRAVERQKQRT